jgi:polar amino acid transport system permease protein
MAESGMQTATPADPVERSSGVREWTTSSPHPWRGLLRRIPAAIAIAAALLITYALITSPTMHWDVVKQYFTSRLVLEGLVRTIYLTAAAMAMGIVLGVILALMRMSRSVTLTVFSSSFIWLFRGTPLLVQIIFWYNLASFMPRLTIGVPFGGPELASWDVNSIVTPLFAALLALGLNEGAYMSEIVRAGITSVEGGQMEAALVLGMRKGQAMRRIILPQAVRIIIPPTGNQAIGMLKGTSLVSVISTPELLYSVQTIYSQNYLTIPLLVVASIWYLILTTILSINQYYLERHYAKGSQRALPPTPYQRCKAWYAKYRSGGLLRMAPKGGSSR